MSISVLQQRAQYPLASYAFRVTVGEEAMSFAEVSGLARGYETRTYRHGLSFWEGEDITKFRYQRYAELTLKKGLIAGAGCRRVYAWLDALDKQPLSVSLCDIDPADPTQRLVEVVTWRIQKALVVRLEAPALLAQSHEAVIETLTLMAAGVSIDLH